VSTQPVLESKNTGEQNISLCGTSASNLFAYIQNGGVPLQFCVGTSDSIALSVGRLSSFSLNPDNQLQVELSDSNGAFANPLLLRTVSSQITSGGANPNTSIKVGIPGSIFPGAHYRLRVVSTSPTEISTSNGSDIAIVANQNQVLNENGVLSAPYGSSYQWLKDGQAIAGAFFQNFKPVESGSYQCQIFNGTCQNLSNPTVITTISKAESINYGIVLYPNPVSEKFVLQIPENASILYLEAIDGNGKMIKLDTDTTNSFEVKKLQSGIYTLRCSTQTGTYFCRFVKQ
jgi:hypothetical protein